MKYPRLPAAIVSILVISACIAASTAYSGNLLLMIAPLLGKHNGPTAPLSHQAVLVGPLAGASIKAFKIAALAAPAEGPKVALQSNNLLSAGTFDLSLAGLADNEWVVVEASSGADIDANGDGITDTSPTENQGTLHALARASDWRTKHLRITPLAEIGYRYVENFASSVSAEELSIRLADLAMYLIKSDINGNGTVDWYDIVTFNPENPAHKAKLAFSYDWLSTANDAGQTILASLRAGETEAVLSQLDSTFSWLMTRFPVPDSRYHSIKVTLAVFGSGRASSGAPHNLLVDSTSTAPVYEDNIFLAGNENEHITFTAAAGDNAKILSWSGCETVSADLKQCTVPLNKSQSVVANFGRTETVLKGIVHDLSRASNILGTNTIAVFLPNDMNDLITEMAAAKVGDFIVGDDDGGFLRKITGLKEISSTYYELQTVEASLDEVVSQGTGHIYKQMTNGDLEGYAAPAAAGLQATVSPVAFAGIEGTTLKVSERYNDTKFIIALGTPAQSSDKGSAAASSSSITADVILYDDGQGKTLTASGDIEMTISFDKGIDFNSGDLRYFKLIAITEAKETVSLKSNYELKKFDRVKKRIGTIRFAPISFFVGYIPVWITPTIDVYLFAEGKIEAEATFGAEFKQVIEGGVLYNKDTGFSPHKSFAADYSPVLSGEISASIKGGVETTLSTKIYDATGPSLPIDRYVQIKASASTEISEHCSDIVVQFSEGLEASFKWDMSGATKIGQLLHLDQLENLTKFSIVASEKQVKEWTIYDTCSRGSFLNIDGNGIFSTIDAGYPNGLATTLTVSNTGKQDLHWNTQNGSSAITISPSSGVITPGEHELIQMSVATAGLPVGRYLRKPFFYNEASVGKNLPDEQFGNTYKTIDITVNGAINDTPEITSATSPAVGKAALNWSFAPSAAEPFVGFQIYATQTPENPLTYKLVHTTDIYHRQAVISGLAPGKTYSFDMRVYSNNGARPGPFSNKVSLKIAGNPVIVTPTKLNDTGITWSGNYASGNNSTCISSTTPDGDNVVAAQDCSHGRDVTDNDDSDGHAGFSYTKLDSNGQPLVNQDADYATTPWACVKDNVTGLIWEVKTDDGLLHDKDDTYTWYNTNPATNGEADGCANCGGNTCYGYSSGNTATYCNTQAYVNRVNAVGWCGASDWRMPTSKDMRSLVHHGRSNPAIDSGYFCNTTSDSYWSGAPYAGYSDYAWYVDFYDGYSSFVYRSHSYAVRLVRGGQ
jgi:hypothetical protein